MLPLTLIAVAALLVACVVVVALIAWHPSAPFEVDPTPLGWCEHYERDGDWVHLCGEPATFELVGAITTHEAGGHSATVASYCAEHAPADAVLVR